MLIESSQIQSIVFVKQQHLSFTVNVHSHKAHTRHKNDVTHLNVCVSVCQTRFFFLIYNQQLIVYKIVYLLIIYFVIYLLYHLIATCLYNISIMSATVCTERMSLAWSKCMIAKRIKKCLLLKLCMGGASRCTVG